ncbi:unnamed protein product [Chondrus crispus]|uniref:Uncharacterized protein n=1 Tax=Chondrus crispus TaxID=2769 RepID=R7QBS4_CHOCR|nr:unnamed protein product [Chondrus crispus]CDF35952.1 unnamed protein product [Chondrus crispus]|eukprot:XP_005715771.1 unnamed protein product [Chondrus crispus]
MTGIALRARLAVTLTLVALLFVCFCFSDAQLDLVAATCPDVGTIDQHSVRLIQSHLERMLPASTFFSVFSVNLDKGCPFWQDDAQCVIRECSVCHCDDSEIPPAWLREPHKEKACRDGEACTKQDRLNDVDRSLTGLAALVGQPVWHTADSDAWTIRDEEDDKFFVDLRKNPEQYTGYSGPNARRIWEAVYDENCFTFSQKCRSGICDVDTCKEERVLYTLISGLHASISMHIAKRYLLGERWGVNTSIYRERLRDHPERIANLKLAFAVVLRAVSKASTSLHPDSYPYVTGNKENDDNTQKEVKKLLSFPILQPGCEDKVFDESDMFLEKNEYLLPEFRSGFRNLSMIMDCVGCEKCRLWGKLQFLGLGTALRILFEEETPNLERNELIALFNVFHKLSSSVIWVEKMEALLKRDSRVKARFGAVVAAILLIFLALQLRSRKEQKKPEEKKPEDEDSGRKPHSQ